MTNRNELTALQVLYSLAKRDEPANLWTLARVLGVGQRETAQLLRGLEERGLVDARRVRLTMSGLVLAVAAPPFARRTRRKARSLRTAA